MKAPQLIESIRDCIEMDAPAWIWGKPGIGKSQIVAQIARERGADCRDIRLSTFDPVDLRGLPAVVDGLTQWMRPQIWPADSSRETYIFFDEMDRAAPAVANAALQIVLDRRIGEHELPATVRIIAAGNGATDKVGTNRISSAQANRFAHFHLEADADAAAAHWASIGLDPALIAFIRFRPALIETAPAQGELSYATPRQWESINRAMHLPAARRHRFAAASVGSAPAGEFEAFVRVISQLPSLDSVIANPGSAPVPADASARYAISAALARKAQPDTFAAVLEYAQRLPREFEIITAVDAVKRNPALCETRAYIAWAARNQDVTI